MMKILEIPVRTLETEIATLNETQQDALGNAYAAGAKDALQWLIDRRSSPSDWLHDRLKRHINAARLNG